LGAARVLVVNRNRSASRKQQETIETGQRLFRTLRWLTMAAVVSMVVASCVLILYLLSIWGG
jgi:hypothetical protein